MKTTTLKTIIAMMNAASDDPTRYHICGVHVETKGNETHLTATNGHILCSRVVQDKLPAGKWIFRDSDAPALKLIIKDNKYADEQECSILPDKRLQVGNLTKVVIEKSDDYPDYHAVIPGDFTHPTSIAFNAEYLVRMLKALEGNPKAPNLRIEFDACKPNSAFRVYLPGSGNTYDTVVMPVRDPRTEAIGKGNAEKLNHICDNAVISLAERRAQ